MTDEIKRAMNIFAWTIKLNETAKDEYYNCYFSGFFKTMTFSHEILKDVFGEKITDLEKEWRVSCPLTDDKAIKKIEDYIKDEVKRLGGMKNEQSGTDGKNGG